MKIAEQIWDCGTERAAENRLEVAERKGFEPLRGSLPCRFSRPVKNPAVARPAAQYPFRKIEKTDPVQPNEIKGRGKIAEHSNGQNLPNVEGSNVT